MTTNFDNILHLKESSQSGNFDITPDVTLKVLQDNHIDDSDITGGLQGEE